MRKLGVKELKALRGGDNSLIFYALVVGLLGTNFENAVIHIATNVADDRMSVDQGIKILTNMADTLV